LSKLETIVSDLKQQRADRVDDKMPRPGEKRKLHVTSHKVVAKKSKTARQRASDADVDDIIAQIQGLAVV
jgi:hypothetical protein